MGLVNVKIERLLNPNCGSKIPQRSYCVVSSPAKCDGSGDKLRGCKEVGCKGRFGCSASKECWTVLLLEAAQ